MDRGSYKKRMETLHGNVRTTDLLVGRQWLLRESSLQETVIA